MKDFILIILVIFTFSLFDSHSIDSDNEKTVVCEKESVMKENLSETQQSLELISKDLKSSNLLTPRRNVQNFQQNLNSRILQIRTKLLHDSRLKGEQEFCKILQFNSYCLTAKLSSFLCRRGYHIYALRKIII